MPSLKSIQLPELRAQLQNILDLIHQAESRHAEVIESVHPDNRERARNFIHYLTLRTIDLRNLQDTLSELGISSLAHAEGYTLYNVQRVAHLLQLIDEGDSLFLDQMGSLNAPFSFSDYKLAYAKNRDILFGPSSAGKNKTHLMVTLPTQAAFSFDLVKEMLEAGMDVARINTSHDDTQIWALMIANVRQAARETNSSCKIYMDLSGPKLRTDLTDIRPLKPKQWEKKKNRLLVFPGDRIWIARNTKKIVTKADRKESVAIISCNQIKLYKDVKPQQRIYFDDGKIGGQIEQVKDNHFSVIIQQALSEGSKLRHEKGINLPETELNLSSLTALDKKNLPFIAENADIVGYSFVRTPHDVAFLQEELAALGRSEIGIVLKIETQEAFRNFPGLILQALRSPIIGVMIARGDLAVEIGFERIAEVQEEIMWLSEAALIPDIWATQVLESLAKKGQATRGDITDAAMATRAACVMLNKGPYIIDAIKTLRNILERMEQHLNRKHGSLRPLKVASRFLGT